MARYTLKSFDEASGPDDSLAFEAFNDNDAVASILSLCDGRGLELWCDRRLVRAWNRPPGQAADL
jgi:hypothetical protein